MATRKSKVVRACAGSGKTHGLIEHLAGLLLEEGASPSEILAITFTRKAAAEMHIRLLERLRKKNTPKAREVLRRVMLRETPDDELTINTFHGWFLTLMQNRPWSLGGHLPARVYDDETQPPLKDIVWRQWLKKTESRPLSPELKTALKHISPWSLKQLFGEFHGQLNVWRLFDDGGARQAELVRQAEESNSARELHKAMADFAESDIAAENRALTAARQAARDICENKAAPREAKGAFVTGKNEVRKVLEKNALAKAAAEQLLDFLHAGEQLEAAKFNQAALALCREFAAEMEAYKQSEEILTFDDLEYQAWRAVVAENMSPEITARLARKYRHILIDEFQDTNPMQWEIVKRWLLDTHGNEDSPSVYIVGDRKQAIYSFRHGEARLLLAAEEFLQDYYGLGKPTDKNTCRRCAPEILDVVNRLFLFNKRPQSDFKFELHEPEGGNEELPGKVSITLIHSGKKEEEPPRIRNPLTTPPEDGNSKREDWGGEVAAAVVGVIGKWQINTDGNPRACKADDVLILLRQMTHADKIVKALAKKGVDCEIAGSRGKLADRFACADLLDLAAVLLFPGRDLHLARVLKSPLFMLDDDELQIIAAKRGDKNLWQSLHENNGASVNLKRAAALLAKWRDRARNPSLPAADLLHSIIGEGDVFARYRAAVPAYMREQVCADINALLDWSLTADDGNRPLLWQFYESAIDAPAPKKSVRIKNTVRLYTIHQAKGLEAPIVVIADTKMKAEGGRGNSADVFARWDAGEENPRDFVVRSRAHKSSFVEVAESQKQREEDEEENLLYVAMTRAQQALLIFALSPPEKTPAARIWNAMRELGAKKEKETQTLTYGALPPAESAEAPGESHVKTPAPNSNITAGKRLPQTPQMIRGRAQHELIALMLLGYDDKEAARITNAAARETTAARKAVNSPQLRALLKDCRAFYVETDIAAGEGKVVRPDLLIVRDDETWVIDYKSGITNPEHHRPQLQTYRQTAAALYPNTPARAAILTPDGELLTLE